MLESARERIEALPDEARVLDVGGWAAPLARADAVLDLLPYATRGLYGPAVDPAGERFGEDTWVQRDICASDPWPYEDDAFDFAVCAHTLEDVRDPVRVCEELSRVARAGYVEVPAPVEELTYGLHGEWVGWSHHHWITELRDGGLVFTMKPHLLVAEGRHLPAGATAGLAPADVVLQLWWQGRVEAREQVLVGAEDFDAWLGSLLDDARAAAAPAATPPRRTRWRRGR